MKMDILILDDEHSGIATLTSLLKQHCNHQIGKIEPASSLEEASALVKKQNFQIAFLDIQLSKGSGFDMVAAIPENCKIIFVTAFSEHALKAIKMGAFDYLLKPIDPKELIDSVGKCYQTSKQQHEQYLTVKSKGITVPIIQSSIIYLKAKGPYSEIHTIEGSVFTIAQTLKDLQEKLNNHFIRTHKSYLVNSTYVEGYNQKNIFLKTNLCFNISRLGLQQLQQFYGS